MTASHLRPPAAHPSAITPVLLCGGSGTRLWPLSRKTLPKQFTPLLGTRTLFQEALLRLTGPGWAAPLIVTSGPLRALAERQAAALGIAPGGLIVEPCPRNTAPAILAAALHLARQDPGALMLIAASDHAIPDAAAFRAAVRAGADAAAAGRIVTFGIRPTRAETGYGWIELAAGPGGGAPRPLPLARFVEKPAAAQAQAMLAAGNYLWNAGIFLATAGTLLAAFAQHAPQLVAPVTQALAGADRTAATLHLDEGPWAKAEDISVDVAVMERAANLCVVPFAAGWSDLGDWDAIWRETATGPDRLATTGPVTAIGCTDSLLRADTPGVELVAIGLKDVVVVALGDAILVADRGRTQEVKAAVARLGARHAPQAEGFAAPESAWSVSEAGGQRLSSRCLHLGTGAGHEVPADAPQAVWTVLSGAARLRSGERSRIVEAGASFRTGAGTGAGTGLRIETAGNAPLVLAELRVTPASGAAAAPAVAAAAGPARPGRAACQTAPAGAGATL